MDEEHLFIIQTMYIRSQGDAVFRYLVAILFGWYYMYGVECRFRRFAADHTFLIKSDNLGSEPPVSIPSTISMVIFRFI